MVSNEGKICREASCPQSAIMCLMVREVSPMRRAVAVVSAALVLFFPAPAPAAQVPPPVQEWIGNWAINMDFQAGTLKITPTQTECPVDRPWCALRIVLERPAGAVQGEIDQIIGNHMTFTLRFAIITKFEAYLFGDKQFMAGTATRVDRVHGFFAKRL
jgi:hypothetical protein